MSGWEYVVALVVGPGLAVAAESVLRRLFGEGGAILGLLVLVGAAVLALGMIS